MSLTAMSGMLRRLSGLSFLSGNKVGDGDDSKGFKPGTAGNTSSTVAISISCRHLENRDVFSKSDPMCAIFYRPPGSRKWVPYCRTEVVENNLDPDFAEKVTMEYRFESVQALRFEVYDVDNISEKLEDQDSLGFVETTLAQIVTAGDEGLTLTLSEVKLIFNSQNAGKPKATISLIAEELQSEKDEVTLKLAGSGCGTWTACLPPKTFFSVSKLNDADKYLVVYRGLFARGSSPNWPPLKMTSRVLCNGDLDRTLKIEIYQRNLQGESFPIASCLTTLNKLLKSTTQDRLEMVGEDGKPTKSTIKVLQCTLAPVSTFLDYIQSGMEIHCSFAIDFTCSNGDPMDALSLHYLKAANNQPSVYEQAMHAVGSIVKEYDKSNILPAYGFGARIPPYGEPSYCFNLTLDKSPDCGNIQGLLDNYRAAMKQIQLYAPTNFETVIRVVTQLASKCKTGEHYYILVIITDGVISDMTKTKKAIIDACAHPISIVIIGVGEADFGAMEELDGDAVRISVRNKIAPRDIVQFVAYRSARAWMGATGECTTDGLKIQVQDDDDEEEEEEILVEGAVKKEKPKKKPVPSTVNMNYGDSDSEDERDTPTRLVQSQLAKEVLFEIPDQLRGYMSSKGITPAMIKNRLKNNNKEERGKEAVE